MKKLFGLPICIPSSPNTLISFLFLLLLTSSLPVFSQNPIADENKLAGTAKSVWDITGAGDLTIQGFATQISINTGGTVNFKIDVDPPAITYTIQIYRLGYYGGAGARLIANLGTFIGVAQPDPLYEESTGKTDCSNWSVSASWTATDAVSGIYLAKLTRTDNSGSSHIVFIVRDDAGNASMLFKTSDATWQAYNAYGGNSLYVDNNGVPEYDHAVEVSYHRPFITRNGGGGGDSSEDWLFNAEYPMLRWLERNGYDVSYTTDLDMDHDLKGITPTGTGGTYAHKVLLSVGHDEYWSAAERKKFEDARDAGVHLAFFSGNEVYWKTRWDPLDPNTLICYKEGTMGEINCGGGCDPTDIWTGLWRDGDPSVYPNSDGYKPENALTGQISWDGSTHAIQVPTAYKNHRFWRNTNWVNLGATETLTLPFGTLGYEWDWEQYHDYYPAGRITLSSTTIGGRTHKLSLYRASSGALVFGAGTVQWSWGLDEEHDRGSLAPSRDMQQATLNLFADMGVQPSTPQTNPVLVAATASTDAIEPVSVITDPAGGSSFQANSPVIITGTATDAGGGIVAGVDVSVDGGTTWKPATVTTMTMATGWTYEWRPGWPLTEEPYTATVKSRAFDDSGNIETASTSDNSKIYQITEPVAPICPCTIWSPSTVPVNINEPDPNGVELGVKFKSNGNGYITGVRFYKSAENTGTHTANLWSATGENLARATIISGTNQGWQEVTFDNPVFITAGITYVASYHTPTGHYSADENYFTTGYESYYLEAVQDGYDMPNGVYTYSTTSAFPSTGSQKTNYWVDVVFALTAEDLKPPVVVSVSPSVNASGVAVTAHPAAYFNEVLDLSSVNSSSVFMTGPGSTPVAGTLSCTGRTVIFTPSSLLEYSTLYTMTLEGGYSTTPIKDVMGNHLSTGYVWSFTTSGPPPTPPVYGPGGPILVISAGSNPFSRYPVEILRAEGFNAFYAMDFSEVTAAELNKYDVVILGEFAPTSGLVTLLTDWVDDGGTLIAMRPHSLLRPLLGITLAGGALSDKYLLVNTASGPGVGIVDETIQFHGTADYYTLTEGAGTVILATLYSSASPTSSTGYPAVTQRLVGENGGKAVAFTYDLARSVVYTRQGNPAWAGLERDGVPPIRSNDLFVPAGGEPGWVDLDKVAIPQADEQQRLLANIIVQGATHRKPMPRFWFLPKGLKAAVVMTGDDHGDAGMLPRFSQDYARVPSTCSVIDWECVRSTGYLYVGNTFTDAQAAYYHGLGFETALHINTNSLNYTAEQFQGFINTQMTVFANTFTSIPRPSTNRNHSIAWSGWSTTAEVSAANNIRLDANYYYWPNSWHQNRPGMFTGSGNPMRFAKEDGTIIDVYQLVTQMQDETQDLPITPFPAFLTALLDKALGTEGYYGVFCANMHFDYATHAGADAIITEAVRREIPVISAKQLLDWLDGRNASKYENIAWSANTLTFDVTAGAGANNLTGMVPVNASGNLKLGSLNKGGSPVTVRTEVIKGINYAFFPTTDGTYSAVYLADTDGPVITNVVATPNTDGTATITWTTDEPASSRVDYGLTSGTLDLNVTLAPLVTSHSVTLTGLNPLSTYYYRVTSTDDLLQSSSMPESPGEYNFNTPAEICARDFTLANFNAGSADGNTVVTDDGGGAVILKPVLIEDFSGTSLPQGWGQGNWTGGPPVFSGGQVSVDGSHVYSNASFGPGSSLEFRATIAAEVSQYVGFSRTSQVDGPWILIGRGAQGPEDNNVYARTYIGGTEQMPNISLGAYLGTPHTYKIKWNTSGNFEFYVDGVLIPAATTTLTVSEPLIIQISDYNSGGTPLYVDWIRVAPYEASGSFTSRVFGDGDEKVWGTATWMADVPVSTSLRIFARGGDGTDPGLWTSTFTEIPASGQPANIDSKYIQYRADLSTGNFLFTPVLKDISIICADPVPSAPEITLEPANQEVCAGREVSFTSAATGYPVPGVQWQVATTEVPAATDWTNIPDATNVTYSFNATMAEDGNKYRAVWSNGVGDAAVSVAATLTVNPVPTAEIAAVDPILCKGEEIQLKLSSATGLAPFSITVNGVIYSGVDVDEVFATIESREQSIWSIGDTPENKDGNDGGRSIEVGFKFRSSVAGYILGIRFYNGENNSGTYTGHLWSTDGTKLAEAVFTNVTKNGWQEVRFSTPVSIAANTTYVASYYSSLGYFGIRIGNLVSGKINGDLAALPGSVGDPNGVFNYDVSAYPTGGSSNNYYTDVVFAREIFNGDVTFNLTSVTDANSCTRTGSTETPLSSATVTVYPMPSGTIAPVPEKSTVYEGEDYELVFNATSGTGQVDLVINGATYRGITSGDSFTAGPVSYTPVPVTLFSGPNGGGSNIVDQNNTELGVIFNSSISGTISGIRFYVLSPNNLNFTAKLWDAVDGTLLATTGTYTNDNTAGWKQINFTNPVSIVAGRNYMASYVSPFPNYYAYTSPAPNPYQVLTSGPLTTVGSRFNQPLVSTMPSSISQANYWVDVVFNSNSSITAFNLTSIQGFGDCTVTGNPLSSTSVTVNRARVWTGTISSEWSNTGNWSTGVVPVAENIVVPAVTPNHYPWISGTINVNDLVIRSSASMTIDAGGALTVSGNLNNSGTLAIKSGLTGSDLTPSGSLIVRGTSAGVVTYERKLKEWTTVWGTNNNFDWHYFSSPVGSNSNANTEKVSAVYSYDEVTGTWPLASITALTPGIGYNLDQTAHGSSDELLTFTGYVVRTAISIGASSPYRYSFDGSIYTGREFASGRDNDANYGGGGWNLLGNPFTSAMNVAAFIDSNNGENGVASDGFFDPNYEALYVYDGSIGDKGTYVIYNTGAIQAGQGFFVLAMNNGVSFSFTPADATSLNMQVHNTSTALLKSANVEDPWPGLELKVKYGSNESSTSILYNDSMTPGLDPGYDIGQLSTSPAVEIYTTLAAKDNGVNFARQALPIAGADTIVVAVGIDSETGGEVTFSAKTVPLGTNKFWLEDRVTGIFTNLNTNTYTVTLPAKTYGTGRFYLKSGTTITSVQPPKEESALRIWTSDGKVIIKGTVSEKAICEIFDTGGRKVVLTRLNDSELNTVTLPSDSKGVYLVRVVDGVKVTTRKVALL